MIRVAVLLGGSSSERAVSLKSGAMVVKHLSRSAYHATTYDPGRKKGLLNFVQAAQAGKIDVVFNALHGTHGEDGHIQGLCELLGLRYTDSGVLASAQALDKAAAKRIFQLNKIPVSKGVLITHQEWKQNQKNVLLRVSRLGSQIVIKPNASGSSVALSVKPKKKNWVTAISKALKEDPSGCLVEVFFPAREFTVPVIETKGMPEALPVIEIVTAGGVFDYHAKYHDKRTQEIVHPAIPASAKKKMQYFAVEAHKALGCRGYSRTDIMWDGKRFIVLETNTLPGLTQASLLPKAAAAIGLDYPKLLTHLIREALRR